MLDALRQKPKRYALQTEVEPDALLDRLLPAIPRGPAAVIGRADDRRLAYLSHHGFSVEAVDFSPRLVVKCRTRAASENVADTETAAVVLPEGHFALIVLDGVLERLPPARGDRLLSVVRRATRPDGVVIATARTTDDPRYTALSAEQAPVARHTYAAPEGNGVVRYHLPGELPMSFEGWILLHATDTGVARADDKTPTNDPGCAVVVARRPMAGTLLA